MSSDIWIEEIRKALDPGKRKTCGPAAELISYLDAIKIKLGVQETEIAELNRALELMAEVSNNRINCDTWLVDNEYCEWTECFQCWIDHFRAEAKRELGK